MTKRRIIQELKENHNAMSHWFKPYDLTVDHNGKTYHIKILPVTGKNLVTINSKYRWDIKAGSVDGIRFKTNSVRSVMLKDFVKEDNPVILLTNKPYQILQYINESEVVDISDKNMAFETLYYTDVNEFIKTIS